jgi:hypothetical protein
MGTPRTAHRIMAGALMAGSIASAGYALAAGSAQALPGPTPQYHGPPHAGGPYRWCPGDDRTGGPGRPFLMHPPNWDWSVFHTYQVVQAGKGNVSPGIWDGDNPPTPPPGPPPPWAP